MVTGWPTRSSSPLISFDFEVVVAGREGLLLLVLVVETFLVVVAVGAFEELEAGSLSFGRAKGSISIG